ncbi:MAG TPA: hypothetical protein DCM38_00620, partial [Gammaproteobacteria bacterium]|nr:hypothetical protein [Gammaproteobacteria bacterium]
MLLDALIYSKNLNRYLKPVKQLIELPKKLKLIRSFKNWTQEEVAEKLGISTHAYAKIERGETDVNLSRLQQIAKVMDIADTPHPN